MPDQPTPDQRIAERAAHDAAKAAAEQESNARVTALLWPNGVPQTPAA